MRPDPPFSKHNLYLPSPLLHVPFTYVPRIIHLLEVADAWMTPKGGVDFHRGNVLIVTTQE